MAADESRAERCSAAKKVLVCVRELPDIPRQQSTLSVSDFLFKKL